MFFSIIVICIVVYYISHLHTKIQEKNLQIEEMDEMLTKTTGRNFEELQEEISESYRSDP